MEDGLFEHGGCAREPLGFQSLKSGSPPEHTDECACDIGGTAPPRRAWGRWSCFCQPATGANPQCHFELWLWTNQRTSVHDARGSSQRDSFSKISFSTPTTEKKNPFYPDRYHLHMLVFYFLKKKKSLLQSNYLTSICINIAYIITLIPVIYFYNNTFLCKIYLLTLFSLYLFVYFFFRKQCKT